MSNEIDMGGVWLIYYGIHGYFEGSAVVTLSGLLKPTSIMDTIEKHILADCLNDKAKKLVEEHGPIVIRNMSKLA